MGRPGRPSSHALAARIAISGFRFDEGFRFEGLGLRAKGGGLRVRSPKCIICTVYGGFPSLKAPVSNETEPIKEFPLC